MCTTWNRLRLSAPHCAVFSLPHRNLLEPTNFNNRLETEACPTWQGKLIGVLLSACSHRGAVFALLCHGLSTAIVLRCWGSLSTFNGKQLHNIYSCSFGSLTSVYGGGKKEKKKLSQD